MTRGNDVEKLPEKLWLGHGLEEERVKVLSNVLFFLRYLCIAKFYFLAFTFSPFSFCLIIFFFKIFGWITDAAKNVSRSGNTKVFFQIIFEVWIFVTYKMQQNYTDLVLLYVADNKIHRQKCCKTKLSCYGRQNIL